MVIERQAEPVALIDLDGTLCDFAGEMRRQLKLLAHPIEKECHNSPDSSWIKARWDLIKRQPGFWENLQPLQLGFDILAVLQDLKFTPHVLTKGPVRTTTAWTEKVNWCRKHVPDLPVTISMDKGLMYGKVLVDDWPSYFMRWLEWRPRGLVVIPAHPWNESISHPNCIRYDGTNLDEVRKRLEIVRAAAA